MPLRIGICGLGSAAQHAHLPALQELKGSHDIRIVAACDREIAQRPAASAAGPEMRTFADLETMLARVPLDLLVIATPPSTHLEQLALAAGRGVDCVCEKPLGVVPGDTASLQSLVDAHPQMLLATVLQYRHAPTWQVIRSHLIAAIDRGHQVRVEILVERPGTDPLAAGGWRAHPGREGGILGDHAVHYLALLHDVDSSVRVIGAERSGEGGHERAVVDLALAGAGARVSVSYAGVRRRNAIILTDRTTGAEMRWVDDRLDSRHDRTWGLPQACGSLADRDFVNRLYVEFYVDLLARRQSPAPRRAITADTLAVAGLLEAALSDSVNRFQGGDDAPPEHRIA